MIVVHRDVYELCRQIVERDREAGCEVRALLAMAMALADGDVKKAATMAHPALVVLQIAAGEPLDVVLKDTRELFETVAKAQEDEEKGVVVS